MAVILLAFCGAYLVWSWWSSDDKVPNWQSAQTNLSTANRETAQLGDATLGNTGKIGESDSPAVPVIATILDRQPEAASSSSMADAVPPLGEAEKSVTTFTEPYVSVRVPVQPVSVPPAEPFRVFPAAPDSDSASVDAIAAALNSELPLVVPASAAAANKKKPAHAPARKPKADGSDVEIITAIIEGRVLK